MEACELRSHHPPKMRVRVFKVEVEHPLCFQLWVLAPHVFPHPSQFSWATSLAMPTPQSPPATPTTNPSPQHQSDTFPTPTSSPPPTASPPTPSWAEAATAESTEPPWTPASSSSTAKR